MTAMNPWFSDLPPLENDETLILNQDPLSLIRDFLLSWPGEETVKLSLRQRHDRLLQIICGYPEIDVGRYPLDWPLNEKSSRSFGLTLYLDNIVSPDGTSSLRDIIINMSYNTKGMNDDGFVKAHRRILATLLIGLRTHRGRNLRNSNFTLEEQKLLIALHSNSKHRVESYWPITEMELSLDRENPYGSKFRLSVTEKTDISPYWVDNNDMLPTTEYSVYEVKLYKIQNWIKSWSSRVDSFQVELISGASAILENIMSAFRQQIINQFGVESIIVDGGGRLQFIGDGNIDFQYENKLKNLFSINEGVTPKFNHELTKLAYLNSGKLESASLTKDDYDLIYNCGVTINDEERDEIIKAWIKSTLPEFLVKQDYEVASEVSDSPLEYGVDTDCILCNKTGNSNLNLPDFIKNNHSRICNFHLLLLLIGRSKRLVDSTTKESGDAFSSNDYTERTVRGIVRLDLNSLGVLFTGKQTSGQENNISIQRRRSIRFNCQWWRILFQSLDFHDQEIDRIVAWVAAGDDLIIADYGGIKPQKLSYFLERLSESLNSLSKKEYGRFKLSFGAGISLSGYKGSMSIVEMLKQSLNAEKAAKSIWKHNQDNDVDRWLITKYGGKIKQYELKDYSVNSYRVINNSVFFTA